MESIDQNIELLEGTLELKEGTIKSIDDACSLVDQLIDDCKTIITKQAKIESRINGERPYARAKLKAQAKDWKSNINTGVLATQIQQVVPRYYMPIFSADTLTAAELPLSNDDGSVYYDSGAKTAFFRQSITEAIRGWAKWMWFVRGISQEVVKHGRGFAVFFDRYDWRPTFVRSDRLFLPTGIEIGDSEIPYFAVDVEYKPFELLALAKRSEDAGLSLWNKDGVAEAIERSEKPSGSWTEETSRSWADLVRQTPRTYSKRKDYKVTKTHHLFTSEEDGTVTHRIIAKGNNGDNRLLFESVSAYSMMSEVLCPLVFEYGDGTIMGSWGIGFIIHDLALELEKIRNGSYDNLRNTNKIKIQASESRQVEDIALTQTDEMVIVAGGTFAGSTAALSQNPEGYMALERELYRAMSERIGSYLPPVAQARDVSAAAINAAMAQQDQVALANLDNYLKQFALIVKEITRRLCDPTTNDVVAKSVMAKLAARIQIDEIIAFIASPVCKSIADFTPAGKQNKAQFAMSQMNNPAYKASELAKIAADAVGGVRFSDAIVVGEGENMDSLAQQSKQLIENTTLAMGVPLPVLAADNDYIHMQAMKQPMQEILNTGNIQIAQLGLAHYSAHYIAGLSKKVIPKDKINAEKSFIAQYEKAVKQVAEQHAAMQQQQMQQQGQGMPMQQQMQQQPPIGQIEGIQQDQATSDILSNNVIT